MYMKYVKTSLNLQDIQSRRLPEPPPLLNGTVGSQIIPGTELISEDKSDFQILPEKDYSDAGYVDMVFRHSESTEDVGGYLR